MTPSVVIRPGAAALDDWRRIAAGAPFSIDPTARGPVEAASACIAAIAAGDDAVYGVNTGFGKLANKRIAKADLETLQVNLVLSHAAGVGAALPAGVVRLVMALKVASLGRGASGVRWAAIETLEAMAAAGVVPVIPSQGSVGASGDLAPLAHLAAAMMGIGAATLDGETMEAAAALRRAGIAPYRLGPKEGLALLNGTQVSTALALAGLFAVERVFRAALVTGALSVDAALGSDAPFDPRIQALRGQPGQAAVAAALRALIDGSEIRASHVDCGKVQDPYSLRCQPQVMGACLDLMRHAAATLAIEANGVSDNPLVFADTGEVLSGGNFHAEPVAFAADMLALATAEIGNLAERRIAMLTDGSISGLPPFLTRVPGLNSGMMLAHVTAAALAAENKQRAAPASIDTLPTSANQEDHVSMATHAARRLGEMAENAAAIVGIELLAAARGVAVHAPLVTSPRLAAALPLAGDAAGGLDADRLLAPEIAAATAAVRDGRLADAVGSDILPAVDPER